MAGAAQRRKIVTTVQTFQCGYARSLFRRVFPSPRSIRARRLSVHHSQSLMCMQAALQRQFRVPFEQQRLFLHGEQLEGDDELVDYGLQDKSVVIVRISPSQSRVEDFQIVEIPAKLPPLRVVFQRIVHAVTYLTILDRMQEQRTHRRVWRQHVTFWDGPASVPRHHSSNSRPRVTLPSDDKRPSSYVLQTSSTEHVASILALATAHGVQSRLHRPPAHRSSADLRNLKKWFASLRYFATLSFLTGFPGTGTYQLLHARKVWDFVFRQGETGDCFYVLVTGCVSLAAYSTGFFRTLTPGSCFGEITARLAYSKRLCTFATAWTELAVVSGDLYRRAIKPYKQVVLRATEKAIASIPRLHALPSHVVTHLAYAAKSLTAREGRHIICRGEEISVLVLLIQGSVKVSKPSGKPIVAVVQAPAVLGQEGALATTASSAPWDVVALDTCSLLCLR
ncbi:Ubiquitin-related domain [Phytophthora cactorum]|nr:Ubiquitin-related domain [Phytophthora cactorum]